MGKRNFNRSIAAMTGLPCQPAPRPLGLWAKRIQHIALLLAIPLAFVAGRSLEDPDGRGTRHLSPDELRQAFETILASDAKDRANVVGFHRIAEGHLYLLLKIADEDSAAGEEARRSLLQILEMLQRAPVLKKR